MRKIIAATFVSINGYFSGPSGEQDWTFPYLSPELRGWITNENKTRHDLIILGATTYTMHKDYWPNVPVEQDASAAFMNNTPKIIISKSLKEAPWGTFNNATVLSENVFEAMKKLKEKPGKDIVIVGSGSIVQQFTNQGLIDEYNIIVIPVILPAGKLLFNEIEQLHSLELLETKAFPDGTVMLRYQSKGEHE